MKKIVILLLTFVMLLSFAACGTPAVDTAPSMSPTADLSMSPATPSESASATLTEMPSPSPTAASSPSLSSSPSPAKTSTLTWPDVDGLTLKDGTYYFKAGNPYGGKEGDAAGVTRKNVYVEGKQVGGICLAADVCKKLLNDALAKIPEGQDRLKVIVPLDISNYDGMVEVGSREVIGKDGTVYSMTKINCPCEAPVVNTIPEASFLNSGYFKCNLGDLRTFNGPECFGEEPGGDLSNNIIVLSDDGGFYQVDAYTDVFFGKGLLTKKVDSDIYISCFDNATLIELNDSFLLDVAGKIVFIISKENP